MKKNVMKWIAMMLFCCVKLASLQACVTCNDEMIDLAHKFYVQPDQIRFSDNKIYINVENLTYETPAVLSDEDGYYIEKAAKSGDCSWHEWQCTRCKTCNLRGIDWACKSCGLPISR